MGSKFSRSELIERRRARLLKLLTNKTPRPGCRYTMSLREASEILRVSRDTISSDHAALKDQLDKWKAQNRMRHEELQERKINEAKALEVLSFTNMVHHYREELGQVRSGVPAHEVLEPRDRSILTKHGILTLDGYVHGGRVYTVDWPVEVLMDRLKVRA